MGLRPILWSHSEKICYHFNFIHSWKYYPMNINVSILEVFFISNVLAKYHIYRSLKKNRHWICLASKMCFDALTNYITLCCIDYTSSSLGRFELITLVVIGTDCIVNFKSNYHTIRIERRPQDNIYNTIYVRNLLKIWTKSRIETSWELIEKYVNKAVDIQFNAHDTFLE